ncbi:glucokinase [Dyella aluminiiresistens]|uniref:glucokinase n=1 Tax=Dyella aluminiiresistens TaxID=3069105 RepID=UPI00399CC92C
MGLLTQDLDRGNSRIIACRAYEGSAHPRLEDIVHSFCEEVAQRPKELVVAGSGYIHAGVVVSRQLAWPVVLDEVARVLGLGRIHFLNTIEAVAHAVPGIDLNTLKCLKQGVGKSELSGPTVVVGVGRGLGVAAWLPGCQSRVLATQAGQMQLAAKVGLEQELLEKISVAGAYTSCEVLLSLPGMHRLYVALCAARNRYPRHEDARSIVAAANDGDELADEALNVFCGWLGAFIGDMAAAYGAGSVCLVGGVISLIEERFIQSPFVDRFLDKGVMRPLLQRVPIYVLDRGWQGVVGAARWHLEVHRPGADTCTATVDTDDVHKPTIERQNHANKQA